MIDSVQFNKVRNSIVEVPFTSPCSFCKAYAKELENNYCNFCYKYFSYAKENDVIIYSISDFLYDLADTKENYNLNWHDFTRLEVKISEKTAKYPFITYNKNKFWFFIDCQLIKLTKEKVNPFSKFIQEIFDVIAKFFIINRASITDKKLLDENFISSFLDGAIVHKHMQMKTLRHHVRIVYPFERKQLKAMICENLNFLY